MNPFRCTWLIIGYALLAVAPPAGARSYANKPINLIVGTTPGGGFDLVAQRLQKRYQRILARASSL